MLSLRLCRAPLLFRFLANLVVRSGARLRPPELSVEVSSSALGLGSCSRTRTPGVSSLAHRTFRSSSLFCRPSRSRRSHTICWGFCEFEGSGYRYAVAVSTSALPSISFPPRNIPIPLPLPLSLLKITPLRVQVRPLPYTPARRACTSASLSLKRRGNNRRISNSPISRSPLSTCILCLLKRCRRARGMRLEVSPRTRRRPLTTLSHAGEFRSAPGLTSQTVF